MEKATLQARRDMPQTLRLQPPKPPQAAVTVQQEQQPSSSSSSPSSLVVPGDLRVANSSQRSISEMLAERSRHSPQQPPVSPAFSDSGASNYESPLTPFSAKWNFAQHHQFLDSPEDGSVASSALDEGASNDSLPRPCSFGDLVMSGHQETSFDSSQHLHGALSASTLTTVDSTEDVLTAPHLPASMRSRQRVSSSNDSFDANSSSDFSPSASVASVRVARIVQRMRSSRLPGSGDNAEISSEPTAPTSLVGEAKRVTGSITPPRSVLLENEWISGSMPMPSTTQKPMLSPPSATKTSPVRRKKVPTSPTLDTARPLSDISVYSVSDQDPSIAAEPDPAIAPEADAMARMRSILGPKTRIISPAPWDADGNDVPVDLKEETAAAPSTKSRRSTDTRSDRKHESSKSVSPSKENAGAKSRLGSRSRSFSMLAARKSSPHVHEDTKESEAAYKSLVMGLGIDGMDASPKKKSKAPPLPVKLNVANAINNFSLAVNHPSTGGADNRSLKSPTSPLSMRAHSSEAERINSRALPVPTTGQLPRSAPADMSSFVSDTSSLPRDASVANLNVRIPAPLMVTTPPLLEVSERDGGLTPTTPTASAAFPSTPTTQARLDPFSSPASEHVPPMSPNGGSKGYKLISLDDARKREQERSAAAALTQRHATAPIGHDHRRQEIASYGGMPARESALTIDSINRGSVSARDAASSPATEAPAKPLRSKKSGFLKRMMGGGDKAETPRVPSLPHDSTSDGRAVEGFESTPRSSVAMPQYPRSPSVQTGLTESPSLSGLASATSMLRSSLMPKSMGQSSSSAPPTRVAFSSTPVPDPEHRLRNGKGSTGSAAAVPSLSLRPISMAFSAGLPSDFLAELEAADEENATGAATPIAPASQSPFAPSFKSTTTHVSSIFETAPTSPIMTPLTPAFPPSPQETLSTPIDESKKMWQIEKAEMGGMIKALRAELDDRSDCPKCGHCFESENLSVTTTAGPGMPMSPSVVDRPRFPGHAIGSSVSQGVLIEPATDVNVLLEPSQARVLF